MITFLCGLFENFSVPILAVQHILPDFTGTFSKKLDNKYTSVIFDIPGNAIQSGNIDYVPAVEDIADEIVELVK